MIIKKTSFAILIDLQFMKRDVYCTLHARYQMVFKGYETVSIMLTQHSSTQKIISCIYLEVSDKSSDCKSASVCFSRGSV